MIKKLSISMALLAGVFSVQAQNQHDFVGFGWANMSTSTIFSETGFPFAVNAEKSLQNGMFVGYSLLASNPTEFTFGKEIPLQDNMHIEATVIYGTNLTYPPVAGGGVALTPTSTSGLSAGATIVMPLAKNQLNFGVTKGISGDYSGNNMVLSATIRINPKPNMFTDLGYNFKDMFTDISYSFHNDKSSFGVIIGMYF
jgi:hypothetical protein